MTKKKPRRSSRSAAPARLHGSVQHQVSDIDALLDHFVLFRLQSVPLERVFGEADDVKALLILKVGGLDDPDLTSWSEEQIRRLLLELVPRHVMQPREMLMRQISALGQYFTFLDSRGLWRKGNVDLEKARAVVEDLVLPVLQVVEDPSQTSEPENIRAFADSLGCGPGNPEAFERFLEWFNGHLTRAERRQISGTAYRVEPPGDLTS